MVSNFLRTYWTMAKKKFKRVSVYLKIYRDVFQLIESIKGKQLRLMRLTRRIQVQGNRLMMLNKSIFAITITIYVMRELLGKTLF